MLTRKSDPRSPAPTTGDYGSQEPHPGAVYGGSRGRNHVRPMRTDGRPLVSVITVVRCGAASIERTIRSVLTQRYDRVEYIIVDGGSTDETVDIIRRFDARIDYWISEPDGGVYDAMNKGIASSRGAIIGILNSDDYYLDGAIEQIVALATNRPDAEILYGYALAGLAAPPTALGRRHHPLRVHDFCRSMPVPHPAMFVKRTCYERHGLYRTTLRIAADYDLILRNFEAGVRFAQLDMPLVVVAPGGVSRREALLALEEEAIVLRHSAVGLRTRLCHHRVLAATRAYMWLARFSLGKRIVAVYRLLKALVRPAA